MFDGIKWRAIGAAIIAFLFFFSKYNIAKRKQAEQDAMIAKSNENYLEKTIEAEKVIDKTRKIWDKEQEKEFQDKKDRLKVIEANEKLTDRDFIDNLERVRNKNNRKKRAD